jgi:aminoglycoside phosphotransferase (APT) family kinase protein
MTPASAPVDAPRPVRPGEELDAARLADHLRQNLSDITSGPLEITQFPSGHSNLTYLVRAPLAAGGTRELVLRRPPFGSQVKSAHDMGREYRILSRLHAVFPRAPRAVLA